MKPILITLIGFFVSNAFSQDTIFFVSGSYVEGKVLSVTDKKIEYTLDKGESPAVYEISRRRIDHITFSSGRDERLSIFKEETADLTKRNLLELNLLDFVFRRVHVNYELFPSKNRDWSIKVPLRMSFDPFRSSLFYSNRPWFETGVGGNLYLLRKGSSNLSVGMEANYTYLQRTYWMMNEEMTFSMEVTDKIHSVGFYVNSSYKYNFKPRLGVHFGVAFGWKLYTEGNTNPWWGEELPQAKLNIGVFSRF